MEYDTTKEECQKAIDNNNNVCDYCGRKLKAMRTVNNSGEPTYWIGCRHGGRDWGVFTGGVSKEIYQLATKLVQTDDMVFGMRNDDRLVGLGYAYQCAIKRACELILKIEYMKKTRPQYTKKELFAKYA